MINICSEEALSELLEANPAVLVLFGGQRFAEFARVFSMGEVRSALERPYRLMGG